ncbi:isoamyl acetate-hydrolyzing esterase [Morchella conica CCBAS932]|uniref:Isoamyl acetate-hydrolyzing esterase n=1 Tax=Morchella conica CCBAS932 TaxID=1392247 RepID=A0A3N4KHW0_9PEZI|nr:isoamyl acetate-hydrolyzing esterase [Morchella conica CCBAS932]
MAFADYDKILLFGDSITEQSYEQTRGFGFGAALADAYKRRLEVVNRGFSGYNTLHALDVLPKIIPLPSPSSRIKLTVVFLGANDAVLPGLPQHVPLDQYSRNLYRILDHSSLKAHNPEFILVGPAPICEYDTQEHDSSNKINYVQRLAAVTKQYSDAALVVGRELGLPTVDLWNAFINHAGGYEVNKHLPGSKEIPKNQKLSDLFRDGLHFSPQGYKILYECLMDVIKTDLPQLHPTELDYVFPFWHVAPKAAPE